MRKRRGVTKGICVVVLLCGILCLLSFVSGTESFADEKAATSEKAPPSTYTDPVTGMEFVYIPGGEFMMGSEKYEDTKPVHKVKVDGFYMGKYEVTQAEWQKVMQESHFAPEDANLPINSISWHEIQLFIKKLNALSSGHFRLPTEAEWEYAARAGSTEETPWDEKLPDEACKYENVYDLSLYDGYFNCSDGFEGRAPVGNFLPNAYGIYDMIGNVAEWCSDFYDYNYYENSPVNNPQGPPVGRKLIDDPMHDEFYPVEADVHLIRGGAYNDRPEYMTVSSREPVEMGLPAQALFSVGFRLAFDR